MATYYKPQSPIQSGEDFIYPITTADQIMKSDKSRRLEQAGLIVADDSTSLGGVAAEDYALKTDTAPDSGKLGGIAAIDYALKTDTAPDSSKLGGKTLAEIMLTLYPVGAVYISANSTSPASLFGGTWEQIKGRFLLATGEADQNSDIYFGQIAGGWNAVVGSTGGQDYHTLATYEMPSHSHDSIAVNGDKAYKILYGAGGDITTSAGTINYTSGSGVFELMTATAGGGQPHNNMPPYLSVYMWKRVS